MTAPSETPRLFDRALLRVRQDRARRAGAETFLLDRIAADLGERLQAITRQFAQGIDLGTPGDQVQRALTGRIDLRGIALPVDDRDPLPLAAESIDLAVSALALHSVNDLPGILAQVRRALKPDGLLLAAMAAVLWRPGRNAQRITAIIVHAGFGNRGVAPVVKFAASLAYD